MKTRMKRGKRCKERVSLFVPRAKGIADNREVFKAMARADGGVFIFFNCRVDRGRAGRSGGGSGDRCGVPEWVGDSDIDAGGRRCIEKATEWEVHIGWASEGMPN